MRRRAVVTAVSLATGGLLLVGCSSHEQSVSTDAMTPVAAVRAATTATSTGTAVLTLTMKTTMDGKALSVTANGPMALDGSKADLTMTLPGAAVGSPGGNVTVTTLVDGTTMYLRFVGSSKLPKTWYSISRGDVLKKTGLGSLNAADSIRGSLQSLNDLGDVTKVGTETIHGVRATHYHADLDPTKVAALAATLPTKVDLAQALGTAKIPVDVWIDDAQHVVRTTETLSLSAQGHEVTEVITTDLSDFGVPLAVTAPSSAVDLTTLLGG
jgi:hypothetical protein